MLATTLGLCLAIVGAGQGPRSADYRAAYEQGRDEANSELTEGRATLYAYGLLRDSLDRATGLLYESIAGCVVDDAILGRAAGHNDRIMQFIEQHGLPSNSYKRWEDELFDLNGYFTARGRGDEPHQLSVDGPAVSSPEGGYTLRLREIPKEQRPDPVIRSELLITTGGTTRTVQLAPLWIDAGTTEIVWGPRGSNLAFFRWSDHPRDHWASRVHGVLDLQTGRWLRQESRNRQRPDADAEPRIEPTG